jgi:hypothetical protein
MLSCLRLVDISTSLKLFKEYGMHKFFGPSIVALVPLVAFVLSYPVLSQRLRSGFSCHCITFSGDKT